MILLAAYCTSDILLLLFVVVVAGAGGTEGETEREILSATPAGQIRAEINEQEPRNGNGVAREEDAGTV